MYIPNPIPTEPRRAYVIHDSKSGWFKIGMSYNPYARMQLIKYKLGRDRVNLHLYHKWPQTSYMGALYIEQTAISLIKDLGFEVVRSDDWFAIDELRINEIIDMVGDLASEIWEWEKFNRKVSECHALRSNRPYGVYCEAEGEKPDPAFPRGRMHVPYPRQQRAWAEPYARFCEREDARIYQQHGEWRAARLAAKIQPSAAR